MIKEYASSDEDLKSDDIKEYFDSVGFSDFVKNRYESAIT